MKHSSLQSGKSSLINSLLDCEGLARTVSKSIYSLLLVFANPITANRATAALHVHVW